MPSDFVKKINLPEGILASRNKDDADLFLTVSNPAKGELVLGETWQVYALAAPFFTVQDDISMADLLALVRGDQVEDVDPTVKTLKPFDNALHVFAVVAHAVL